MKALPIIPFLIALSQLAGCASASVSLRSTPDKATVVAQALGGGEPKELGETPVILNSNELQAQLGKLGPVYFEFKREGYGPTRMLVTDISAGEIVIDAELKPSSGLDNQDRLNMVVDQLFECQRLARAGRLEDAMTRLRELERQAPNMAAIYELQGGVLYIQRKYAEAFDAYSIAVKLNPTNSEAQRMRNLIAATLGSQSRVPAQQGGGR